MDLSRAMRNLQETKKANSKELAEVAKTLKENKFLKEGIIDDLQKGKDTDKRDGSKAEINKAVKEEKEIIEEVKQNVQMSEEDQDKYYFDTYKDTNGTFYDVYKIDGKLYDIFGNEVKEKTEAKLTEDQYEAERRKGRTPNAKTLAKQVRDDDLDYFNTILDKYKNPMSFINDMAPEIAAEYNLSASKANVVASEVYRLAEQESGKEVKEEKKLTELRHVDKKKIVKAYDFTELSDGIQKNLIDHYFKYNTSRGRRTSDSPKDLIIDDLNDQFSGALESATFFKGDRLFRSSDSERSLEKIINDGWFNTDISLDQLSSELAWDNDYYTKVEVNGALGEGSWSFVGKKILEKLSDYTNYDELPKSTKKEIIVKIKENVEKAKSIITEYHGKTQEALSNATDSISDFEKLLNKPAVDELSKYWYTEEGTKIISKDKAKVVEGEINEALITEAPVNLEMDFGYDVYSYDDLDDWGKKNAFNSTERSRKNEYEKTFNILKDRITEMVNEEVTKAGLKLDSSVEESVQVRSYDKGSLSSVYVYIDNKSLIEYAKANGIELQPKSETEYGEKEPECMLEIGFNGRGGRSYFEIRTRFINSVKDDNAYGGYREDDEARKELRNEIELDLKGLLRKVERIEKQFRDAIDDDFRNRLSTDKKLKRREYDSKGNIYRDKKNEK